MTNARAAAVSAHLGEGRGLIAQGARAARCGTLPGLRYWRTREAARPPSPWTLLHSKPPRNGGPGPQGSGGLNQDFPKAAAGPSDPLTFCTTQRPSAKSGQADGASENSVHLDIQKLKEKRDVLDKELSQFTSEGYSVDELEDHISQLHEYNDIKDVGQMLLGKLAVIRGVTTKELYPEFGLDVND